MRGGFLKVILILVLALTVISVASAQEGGPADRIDGRSLPAHLQGLQLDQPLQIDGVSIDDIKPAVTAVEGRTQVIVHLDSPSVIQQNARSNRARHEARVLKAEQNNVLAEIERLDPTATELARVQVVLNAVIVEVDGAVLPEIAALRGVARVAQVSDYELFLSDTVPYIGGTAVQDMGYDGTGVSVAVLDSGIDYYHAALGGSGDPADYAADDPSIIESGTFPTAKVVGGYDFVGPEWPEAALAPDPDPLDDGPGAGHGTHVGHIIGGEGGVAPGADLYAVKVCSSVSSACSGVALIQAMEFSVDPDGDGDPSDHVDVINMSLGANYGTPFDDDLSLAVDNATAVGALTVSSAGNGSDKPYVLGTPAGAVTAIAVAQTQVPSAVLPVISVGDSDYLAAFQAWSVPLEELIEGELQYGDGAGGNLNGCGEFAAGSLDGKVVLVDRGACFFTTKIFNIGQAGGVAGIIGLIAPGEPFSGGFADPGGEITIPGFMVSQADSEAMKEQVGMTAVLDPAKGLPLVGQMVGSSSRGPRMGDSLLKPDIGAPGASVSAVAGTGTQELPFGGTSGASPMVAGAAALLLQAEPMLSPPEVKARLMNTGETEIDTDPFSGLTPVSRIGGGEVRVDRALAAEAAAWDRDMLTGSLGFGFVDVAKNTLTLNKQVHVQNYSDEDLTFSIMPTFRYDNDADSGAVEVIVQDEVWVAAGGSAVVPVTLKINGAHLWDNWMNSGSQGANGAALTINEFDGYLKFMSDEAEDIHMAWHVLPRKASWVTGQTNMVFKNKSMIDVRLQNRGVGAAQNNAFSLLAVSPDQPEGARGQQSPTPDIRSVGIATYPAGFCDAGFVWAFAINTWERQQHLLPVKHFVYLDVDQDGASDYLVFNNDVSLFSTGSFGTISDGRQITLAFDLAAGSVSAFFWTEHSTNTGNTILYVCGEQVGMSATDMAYVGDGTNVNMAVEAFDFYYGGPGDFVGGLTVTPLGEQYLGIPEDLPGKSGGTMTVYDFGSFPGNSPELGVMLVTNGDRGAGARGGATQDSEAILFMAK
ncbi:MAG: S8 family serine peptidase [Candidatus Promineifilaceae bacterium]|nr:S8 family serine peptidase [Candidatus Promineifilaceae bacterium]